MYPCTVLPYGILATFAAVRTIITYQLSQSCLLQNYAFRDLLYSSILAVVRTCCTKCEAYEYIMYVD